MPGFEYKKAKKTLGICELRESDIPEVAADTQGLPINFFLFRILSFSNKLLLINRIIFSASLKKIKRKKYDAINIIGQWPWVEYIHDGLRTENIIHTFHEVGSHYTGKRSNHLIDKVIRDCSKVILPSQSTFDRFLEIGDINNAVKMIPIGKMETLLLYEKDVNYELGLDISKPTFLFYGYLKPYKGLDVLKGAMEELKHIYDKFNLIVAGSGTDPNLEYFEECPNCKVLNHFLSNDEMMYLIRRSSCLLLPYKSASQSGIVLVSFMLGKPIIATKVGALVETIKDGYNGLLVPANSPDKFAAAIELLITDNNMLTELSLNAKKFGDDDEYDWTNIAKKTIEFYFQ